MTAAAGVMTEAELAEYEAMPEADRRARRRELAEQFAERDERDRQTVKLLQSQRCDPDDDLRRLLEAFERGDDDLFGMPRSVVNFPAVYAALDREAERRRRMSA